MATVVLERANDGIAQDNLGNTQSGNRESTGVIEEMFSLGVRFEDVTLEERIKPAIQAALACKASCAVNPINTLHKIRDAFGQLASDGEITADESVACVARMMNMAGEEFVSRKAVVEQFKAGNLSALKL